MRFAILAVVILADVFAADPDGLKAFRANSNEVCNDPFLLLRVMDVGKENSRLGGEAGGGEDGGFTVLGDFRVGRRNEFAQQMRRFRDETLRAASQ